MKWTAAFLAALLISAAATNAALSTFTMVLDDNNGVPQSGQWTVYADVTGGSEEELKTQLREIFSLKELASLGSSIVSLAGGSAVLDDNGHRVEIHVEGQPVGLRAARLVVSQVNDGQEIVAGSVIARTGKTVVLAGPPADDATGGHEIAFVCLTPFR